MTTVYIFAPTRAHAERTIRDEHLLELMIGDENLRFEPRTFQQILGLRFEDGDQLLIRGLKSIGNVDRMKYIVTDLVYVAAVREQYLVMAGLDNYRVVPRKPHPILMTEELMRKINKEEFERETKEPLQVDRPEYDKQPGFFEGFFGRLNRG